MGPSWEETLWKFDVLSPRQKTAIVLVGELMSGCADLPEVGCASRRLRRRGYVLVGRPRNGGEKGNDRHDHQQFDQGQACKTLAPSRRHATTAMRVSPRGGSTPRKHGPRTPRTILCRPTLAMIAFGAKIIRIKEQLLRLKTFHRRTHCLAARSSEICPGPAAWFLLGANFLGRRSARGARTGRSGRD